jgi:hypothetical protein
LALSVFSSWQRNVLPTERETEFFPSTDQSAPNYVKDGNLRSRRAKDYGLYSHIAPTTDAPEYVMRLLKNELYEAPGHVRSITTFRQI